MTFQAHDILTAAALALAGLVVGAAAIGVLMLARGDRPARRSVPAPALPISTGPDADAYLPCHTTTCAHLERPHARTPAGLTCRHCHHTVTEAPRA